MLSSNSKSASQAEIASARATFFAKWLKVANDLAADETKLKSEMSCESRKILQPIRILLWQATLKDTQYSDSGVVWEVTNGTDLVGETPVSGLFNTRFRPAQRTVEDLMSCAQAERESILQSISPQGDELDAEVLEKIMEEMSKGWVSPVDPESRPDHAVVSRCFGLAQTDKIRLIDDLSASGVNRTM